MNLQPRCRIVEAVLLDSNTRNVKIVQRVDKFILVAAASLIQRVVDQKIASNLDEMSASCRMCLRMSDKPRCWSGNSCKTAMSIG